ncbi:hypothetical protein ACH42_07990 [Endozoicomonas sp. (ex Bugula neritina AB1)]|nr:hypothetical protein ACH42_07990 [Endozoicomonas sp. (ex Bugula neritina AB1)]
MRSLNQLDFNNTFSRLPEGFYSSLPATPLHNPKFVAYSPSAGQLLDLQDSTALRDQLTQVCSGNAILPGSEPIATVYSGHQFGVYVPQLGDGRSLLLGEVRNSQDEKWDLHLKGGGPTPYSRFGDGRAVLRSCIREYLASEALYHLGIPTTRALCIVTSETPVYREETEAGSTLLRLAKSHIRFGHFEYFYYTKRYDNLETLANYVIEQNFPQLLSHESKEDQFIQLFEIVVQSTAKLIAQWQAVGFAHGVMNTDNMSIIGDTIDYGPYSFMDDFNWHYICNHSDHQGRYAFSQQPEIGYWNCSRLAQALTPLIKNSARLQTVLDSYPQIYSDTYKQLMGQKLGLTSEESDDESLLQSLLQLMHSSGCDYTQFFRALCDFSVHGSGTKLQKLINKPELPNWLDAYSERLKKNNISDEEHSSQMKQANPKYILRNYLAQQAITKAEQGDYSEIEKLMRVLSSPFEEHPDYEEYANTPPEWGKKLEVSCSS